MKKELWVVIADDHDYDAMSQWLVGVFETEQEAIDSARRDKIRYIENGGNKDRYNFQITNTYLGEIINNV